MIAESGKMQKRISIVFYNEMVGWSISDQSVVQQ